MKQKLNFNFVALSTIVLIVGWLLTYSSLFEVEEVEEPIIAKVVDPKQLACLAANIFYEAGSETLNGQAAVARVVMNRINHGFASNPCKVIYQSTMIEKVNKDTFEPYKVKLCQFSWVCEGKGTPNKNDPRYKQAEEVAYQVLAYDAYTDIVPTTALFFHNLSVDPLWPYRQVAKIGNHIFYSKAKKQPTQPKVLQTGA